MSSATVHSVSPVFIVGAFRSGTSLLYSLLNQHPQVALMYECDVWHFPNAFNSLRFRGEWLQRQEFYNQVLSRHRLVWEDTPCGLEQVRTPADLYRCYSETKTATVWGEKSPLYGVRLRQIARRYPQASFIYIWRDPAEIYRSIEVAGKKSKFFRRPGMLHWLIHHHEKVIREVNEIQRDGARIFHVHYDDLVDHTEVVCRDICGFLQIDFDPRMTRLAQADFSAVYQAPQHDFLRRGVVERRSLDQQIEKTVAQKLARFRKRWERLAGRQLGLYGISANVSEPPSAELLYHRTLGAMLHAAEECRRLAFEFVPLSWLQTYRQFKCWLVPGESARSRRSIGEQFRQHRITVLASFLVLALVAFFDYYTGPEVAVEPLYLIPCAALALIVGRSWATIAAVGCVILMTLFRDGMGLQSSLVLNMTVLWNMAMYFIFLEIVVLLLDRIRHDFKPTQPS